MAKFALVALLLVGASAIRTKPYPHKSGFDEVARGNRRDQVREVADATARATIIDTEYAYRKHNPDWTKHTPNLRPKDNKRMAKQTQEAFNLAYKMRHMAEGERQKQMSILPSQRAQAVVDAMEAGRDGIVGGVYEANRMIFGQDAAAQAAGQTMDAIMSVAPQNLRKDFVHETEKVRDNLVSYTYAANAARGKDKQNEAAAEAAHALNHVMPNQVAADTMAAMADPVGAMNKEAMQIKMGGLDGEAMHIKKLVHDMTSPAMKVAANQKGMAGAQKMAQEQMQAQNAAAQHAMKNAVVAQQAAAIAPTVATANVVEAHHKINEMISGKDHAQYQTDKLLREIEYRKPENVLKRHNERMTAVANQASMHGLHHPVMKVAGTEEHPAPRRIPAAHSLLQKKQHRVHALVGEEIMDVR